MFSTRLHVYAHVPVFLDKTFQGEVGLLFTYASMEEVILPLGINLPIVHAIVLIRKGTKGRTAVFRSLEGLSWVSVRDDSGRFL